MLDPITSYLATKAADKAFDSILDRKDNGKKSKTEIKAELIKQAVEEKKSKTARNEVLLILLAGAALGVFFSADAIAHSQAVSLLTLHFVLIGIAGLLGDASTSTSSIAELIGGTPHFSTLTLLFAFIASLLVYALCGGIFFTIVCALYRHFSHKSKLKEAQRAAEIAATQEAARRNAPNNYHKF